LRPSSQAGARVAGAEDIGEQVENSEGVAKGL
jgi:hypothetical protein